MRILAACILTTALATGAAKASSLVVLGEATPPSSSSILILGATTPAKMPEPLRVENASTMAIPSILALGEPDTTDENDAAKHGPTFQPLVIRGGISGDAFAPAPSRPADVTASNTDTPPPPAENSAPAASSAPPEMQQ